MKENLAGVDPELGSWSGWKTNRGEYNGHGGIGSQNPLTGLVLDANQMVVRKTVGTWMVLGFHRGAPIPHHHVEDGDRATERRKGGEKD